MMPAMGVFSPIDEACRLLLAGHQAMAQVSECDASWTRS